MGGSRMLIGRGRAIGTANLAPRPTARCSTISFRDEPEGGSGSAALSSLPLTAYESLDDEVQDHGEDHPERLYVLEEIATHDTDTIPIRCIGRREVHLVNALYRFGWLTL
jgi:hypothetical protein